MELESFKVITTFKCDICGEDGVGWKRRSYRMHHNGQMRLAPVAEPRVNLCAEHFKTHELEDIDIQYDECDDYLKKWWEYK